VRLRPSRAVILLFAVPSLTLALPPPPSARLFGMVNQLPTVYKALSGDDGKQLATMGAKKKVRLGAPLARGLPGLATPLPPRAQPWRSEPRPRLTGRSRAPLAQAYPAPAPSGGAKRERQDPEVRLQP